MLGCFPRYLNAKMRTRRPHRLVLHCQCSGTTSPSAILVRRSLHGASSRGRVGDGFEEHHWIREHVCGASPSKPLCSHSRLKGYGSISWCQSIMASLHDECSGKIGRESTSTWYCNPSRDIKRLGSHGWYYSTS